jgi:hypothetical protein
MMTREQIAQILSIGEATVKFTKVDGSSRVMHCTIAPYLIPEDQQPKGELLTEVPINLSVLRVFDLDLQEWRSFRVDHVKEVTVGYTDENQCQLLSE